LSTPKTDPRLTTINDHLAYIGDKVATLADEIVSLQVQNRVLQEANADQRVRLLTEQIGALKQRATAAEDRLTKHTKENGIIIDRQESKIAKLTASLSLLNEQNDRLLAEAGLLKAQARHRAHQINTQEAALNWYEAAFAQVSGLLETALREVESTAGNLD